MTGATELVPSGTIVIMTGISRDLIAEVDRAYAEFAAWSLDAARRKPAPDKWSAQEIIGHLIDSASNNHQRFVRPQQGGDYSGPGYEQEHWVSVQGYRDAPWMELLDLWRLYNRHLARVIERVAPGTLGVTCHVGEYAPATLGFVIEDYLAHLRHHLRQVRAIGDRGKS